LPIRTLYTPLLSHIRATCPTHLILQSWYYIQECNYSTKIQFWIIFIIQFKNKHKKGKHLNNRSQQRKWKSLQIWDKMLKNVYTRAKCCLTFFTTRLIHLPARCKSLVDTCHIFCIKISILHNSSNNSPLLCTFKMSASCI
jgi:hypothetical protein